MLLGCSAIKCSYVCLLPMGIVVWLMHGDNSQVGKPGRSSLCSEAKNEFYECRRMIALPPCYLWAKQREFSEVPSRLEKICCPRVLPEGRSRSWMRPAPPVVSSSSSIATVRCRKLMVVASRDSISRVELDRVALQLLCSLSR